MAGLQQLHFFYQPGHDRILFRIGTADGSEFRIWLTRRMTRPIFNLLVNRLHSDAAIQTHKDEDVKKEIFSFQHQEALQNTEFKQKFQTENVQSQPLGQVPLLVIEAEIKPLEGDKTLLSVKGMNNNKVDLTLEKNMIHSMCKLIQDISEQAEWDLGLELPKQPEPDVAPSSKTLN